MIRWLSVYVIVIGLLCNVFTQKGEGPWYYILEVDMYDTSTPGHFGTIHLLIEEDSLYQYSVPKSFSFFVNGILNDGAYLVSESFTDIYTLGCCEYGVIENAIQKFRDDDISQQVLDKYSGVNQISIDTFSSVKRTVLTINEQRVSWRISVSKSSLEYCLCNLYMENPAQSVPSELAAYVSVVYEVSALNDYDLERLRNVFAGYSPVFGG